jgi:NMD protein affecting ribosome stability and mRNA decay
MNKNKGRNFKQERTRIYDDKRIDPYRKSEKYKEPTQCPKCNALFINGRWTWNDTSEETNSALCPACRRIKDEYPAGIVTLSGSFLDEHRKEILHMIKNLEQTESQEHPLERIMGIEYENGSTIINTTGMHLARRFGNSLQQAYEGDLDISYDAENFVRVSWHRD